MSNTDYQVDTYILSWDMNGLESCVNATQIDRERVWNTLANKDERNEEIGRILSHLTMRARFNSHRHYEIYAIDVSSDITQDVLVEQFNEHPQAMADLIRARGKKLYSDRVNEDRVVIR